MIGKCPRECKVSAIRTMFLRPRMVSQVEINSKESTLEVGSRADTTCLGHGALKIFDFNCPVNVQGYDPSLGIRQYQTMSGVIAYVHPFYGHEISHCYSPSYSHA